VSTGEKNTYGSILKSSALIGGSSLINVGISIVRAKAMALLLGPGGVGLLGLLNSVMDLARTTASLGLSSSGVRQIAEAAATQDGRRIARTAAALRNAAVLLGILGGLLLAFFSRPIAVFSFGDAAQQGAVALLGVAVLLGSVAGAQLALLQGLRRIRELAMANVVGAFLGTLGSILIILAFRREGLAASLICVALMTLAGTWWYVRRVELPAIRWRWSDLVPEVSALLKLGVVFMASGLMTMAVGYFIRLIVMRKLGEDAAGFYQAAWALGGLYVGFILQAMGADFFPRLTAVAQDHSRCNRMVNEQTEIGLLLAGPGLLATLTFAPWVIRIFYSGQFGPAVEILRWICLGMMLRVVSWPMGYILLAKGVRRAFFWSELAANLAQVGLAWLGVLYFGLKGTGMAFFASYLFYWIMIYVIVRSLSGFRFAAASRGIGLLYLALITLLFVGWYLVPEGWIMVLGTLATMGAGTFSCRRICSLVPFERLPGPAQRVLVWLRLAAPPAQV
jgi:PST family polysaccharide transporter